MRNLKLHILLNVLLVLLVVFITPTEALAVVKNLNGQTGDTQTFQNDSNIIINSLNNIHSINWQGLLPVSRGGTGASSFTAGSLLFSDGLSITQDNFNLFWDNTNNRLGIGTSSPTSTLDIFGNVTATRLISTADSTINSLNIGLGGGSVATNTSVGKDALLNANSNSYSNTAVGYRALVNQGSGGDSTAVGFNALANNTTGSDGNTAVGSGAMKENTTGRFNTAIGGGALSLNTTGEFNTALGLQALGNSNNNSNVAIGFRSGYYQADGSPLTNPQYSVYIGEQARGYNNNDFNSIVIGQNTIGAGANTTVIGNSAMENVYFGSVAGLANIHATTLFLGSSTTPGCIVMGDSDGSGVTYVTANNGVLTPSTTQPSACQ